MKKNTCLLIKPDLQDDTDIIRQEKDMATVLRAIREAGLTLPEEFPEGFAARDISPELIRSCYDSEILVIDANYYGNESIFPLSPYLFYYMGSCHSMGNRTILVSRTDRHLPYSFVKHHTIVYSKDRLELIDQFKQKAQSIQNGDQTPDNPIQTFLKDREKEAELAELKEKLATRGAAIDNLQTVKKQGKILFKRVSN